MDVMDVMLDIVTCPKCKKPEYWGMMHWLSGKTVCRKCIYEIWKNESKHGWVPSKTDYVYPLYCDGKEYSKVGE